MQNLARHPSFAEDLRAASMASCLAVRIFDSAEAQVSCSLSFSHESLLRETIQSNLPQLSRL
ncbi:MAG: hypothetical protein Ct9H90mP23_3290 [Methanobacteriota archaeon]|nr:MAG: hypothetical protein Ct9H90mP23_3290 [Euryarchaeota archaeon]